MCQYLQWLLIKQTEITKHNNTEIIVTIAKPVSIETLLF